MKILLALLALLGSFSLAADIIPAKKTIIQVVSGGNDPTKLPLAGGVETGSVYFVEGASVAFKVGSATYTIAGTTSGYLLNGFANFPLTSGVNFYNSTSNSAGFSIKGSTDGYQLTGDVLMSEQKALVFSTVTGYELRGSDTGSKHFGELSFSTSANGSAIGSVQASTYTQGGLDIAALVGGLGSSAFNFRSSNGGSVVIILSSSPNLSPATAPIINFDAFANDLTIILGNGGGLNLQATQANMSGPGGVAQVITGASNTNINGSDVIVNPSANFTSNAPVNNFISGVVKMALTPGQVTCTNAAGNQSSCTSVVGVTGGCTCP